MIRFDRLGERLVLTRGPTFWYQVAASVSGAALGTLALLFAQGIGADLPRLVPGALVAILVVLTAGLIWGWRTTEYCFDVSSADLNVTERRAGVAGQPRRIPLSSVRALVDRRAAGLREVELVLADQSVLVLARGGRAATTQVDAIAQQVSSLLGKPLQLASGTLVAERFEIERLVQVGGMGAVYRALDRSTREAVALKLMLSEQQPSERAERFAREIAFLGGLDHPRIARHIAHGTTDDGREFLVMEWLDGEDLAGRLDRGPLSPADALSVLRAASEALAPVHARGIIHRDLKPSNLFLRKSRASDLVLLDFGVARRLTETQPLTGTSVLVGTPHYMAPEQARSERELSPALDVFALGVIFYECLTGLHPFGAQGLVGVLARILFDVPEPLGVQCPDAPTAWSELVARMLSKDPLQRPVDATALLGELERLPPPLDAREPQSVTRRSELPVEDQVLVCVVLTSTVGVPSHIERQHSRVASIKSAMQRFGCPVEWLADGSLLVVILPRQSAADLARIAARCALFLREQLPGTSFAIATGHAALRLGPRVGDAVDKAARLLRTGAAGSIPPGSIVVDPVSSGLLEDRFVTHNEGEQRLLVGERTEVDTDRLLLGKPTPCVGRNGELLQLEGLVSSALDARVPRTALVLGPPGIGKSRLRRELLRRLDPQLAGASVLLGYGDLLSAGSPYVLIADALLRHAGISVGEDLALARDKIRQRLCVHVASEQQARIAEFLGELMGVPFPDEHSPPLLAARNDHRVMGEQIELAFTHWLTAECRAHPVLLVLEDAQWGDALTVKLLEAAERDVKEGAFVALGLARPEVAEVFPEFLRARTLTITLHPLGERASRQLIESVLGPDLDEALLSSMVRSAAGNALFLEELVRANADGKPGAVPETVLAMLKARLSRLPAEARRVLLAASVLGETFWTGAVRGICQAWESPLELQPWIERLIAEEIIAPLSSSRFAGQPEYGFRHALVCEAAFALLGDGDRASGHRAAWHWLQGSGENDAIVLARHAEQAKDISEAARFFTRAAEQSLGQHDFVEALARVERGIACGAAGAELGHLLHLEAAACCNLAEWQRAARAGLGALDLVERGGSLWCTTVETLLTVLPHVGEEARGEQLSEELMLLAPTEEARPAFMRAISAQIHGYSLRGKRSQAERCLEFVERFGVMSSDHDLGARGSAGLFRSVFTCFLTDELELVLTLTRNAARDLRQSQVMYRLSLTHVLESLALWGLGDLDGAERVARQAYATAEQIRDKHHQALASWYIGVPLSEQDEPSKLEAADRAADAMRDIESLPIFRARSSIIRARTALCRRQFERAESEAREARANITAMPPFQFMASATLLAALTALGRTEEARAIALEDLAALERVASPVISEVALRVTAAEALYASGDARTAETALRRALSEIERRVSKLSTPARKDQYLGRPENRRATELLRKWVEPHA